MTTVLHFAETDADLRDAYNRLGSARGFRVETSADGFECLRRVGADVPDVLVVNLDIPWGGGDGVLACLRDSSSIPASRPVFVTGDDSPEDLSRRSGIPTDNCFQKPYRVSDLLDSICQTLLVSPRFVTGSV